jgi:hypothetical protein
MKHQQDKNTPILFLESSKNIGGQEFQLLQQMQELNKLGYETKLLCKLGSRVYDFAISNRLNVELIGLETHYIYQAFLQLCGKF